MDEEQFYGKYYEFLKETENHVTDIIKTAITNEDSTECPVKYISHRIKKPNSVINKLKRKNLILLKAKQHGIKIKTYMKKQKGNYLKYVLKIN